MPCVIWVNVHVNALLRLCSLQGNGYISTLPSLQSHFPLNSAAQFTQKGRKGHQFSLSRWQPFVKESCFKRLKAELGKSNGQQIKHVSEWAARLSEPPILSQLFGSSINLGNNSCTTQNTFCHEWQSAMNGIHGRESFNTLNLDSAGITGVGG